MGANAAAIARSSSHPPSPPLLSIYSLRPFCHFYRNLHVLTHDAPKSFEVCSAASSSKAMLPRTFHNQIHKKPHKKWRKQEALHCLAKKQDTQTQNPESAALNSKSVPLEDYIQNWQYIGLYLFSLGFILGPLLDGIHSRVQLQVYDEGALDIGALHTNIWVFPLLGTFYVIAGLLQLALDSTFRSSRQLEPPSLEKVASSLIFLALILELSAELYKAGTPYNIEAYILFALAQLNWALFDSTWWGFLLACVVGVGCPLFEIPIVKYFGLWHYPKANFELFGEGLVTWVICCYFSYTPFIANLSRWLNAYFKSKEVANNRLE